MKLSCHPPRGRQELYDEWVKVRKENMTATWSSARDMLSKLSALEIWGVLLRLPKLHNSTEADLGEGMRPRSVSQDTRLVNEQGQSI